LDERFVAGKRVEEKEMTEAQPMFSIGQKVVDPDCGEVGAITSVEYNDALEEYIYETTFSGKYDCYLDAALMSVETAS
jgi:hypothetical protein